MAQPQDDPEIERIARERGLAAGYRAAARRAIAFARRYRQEEGAPGGARERACVAQALEWREASRDVLEGRVPRPGLARARPDTATEDGETRKIG
jgi:hypothetical protein